MKKSFLVVYMICCVLLGVGCHGQVRQEASDKQLHQALYGCSQAVDERVKHLPVRPASELIQIMMEDCVNARKEAHKQKQIAANKVVAASVSTAVTALVVIVLLLILL